MAAADPVDMPNWSKVYSSYSPAEFAQITGISEGTQRAWRLRGHLPPLKEGQTHARFSPEEVIAASIRSTLSKLGVPPIASYAINEHAISGALYHAILSHDGSCEVIGPPDQVEAVLKDFRDDLASRFAKRSEASNYLIWDDENGVRVVDDFQHVFDQRTVFIIAIDLTVIGARMMERGRKPIVTLEARMERDVRRVRRLSGVRANDNERADH
jgi:hypothetical protein